jgi:hypothetical protein
MYIISSATNEGFWNIPARTWKVEKVLRVPGKDGPDFLQTPSFQGILSPRFSNVNYGPYLKTQLPDYQMMGVPADPLGGDFGGSFYAKDSGPNNYKRINNNSIKVQVAEGFGEKPIINDEYLSYSSMNVPGTNLEFEAERLFVDPENPSGYTNGNYKQVLQSLVKPDLISDNQYGTNNDGVTASYLTADGEMKQPIIYDRFLYANRHSRLRSQGDWFRGDLPIVPNSGNWFVPSVHPNIDLNAGAINVMAGVNNETNHQLASLIYNSSGGGDTCIGGIDLEPVGQVSAFSRMNMGNRNYEYTTSAGGDVIVTSFP